jgi:hypothetical protein
MHNNIETLKSILKTNLEEYSKHKSEHTWNNIISIMNDIIYLKYYSKY